ncbi:MAG: c-type cytochrome [Burkholderiaceae bacterium]|jgi:cytochrome c553|nr:c-type cytochrome [Burkholderiaceae bacterium]
MKQFLISIFALALLPLAAQAQTPANALTSEQAQALLAKADPKRGAELFVACEGCHRKDATGRPSGAYPRLAGQHAPVLIKQMLDIRSGLRANPKMKEYVDDHLSTPADAADAAAYLSALPIPLDKIGLGPGSSIEAGKKLFDRDCAQCHGASGEGNPTKFYPMVAAQHYRYLLRELHFIRDGDRGNSDPEMVKVVKPYLEDDLVAVADYMASLPPPKK